MDTIIDKKLKIQTNGRDDYKADDYHHPYEPTSYEVLERLAESGYITKDNIVIDYGCGKGRVGFYLSAKLGCRNIGVEYDERMYEFALKNQQTFTGRGKPEFVCIPAEKYIVEDGDCFYFFNPFTVEILHSVLGKIMDSYYDNPRAMTLFFYYPDEDYVAFLMTREELMFVDEISCEDLFEGKNSRERILVFEVERNCIPVNTNIPLARTQKNVFADFQDELSDRLFDENRMYSYIKTYASVKKLPQTSKVLPYARELHKGQFRKGKDQVPYIYHPLLVACHALSLGLEDDNLVSAALLHDVCEDCGVAIEDLPVNDETKAAIALLTKNKDGGKSGQQYYEDIFRNPIAIMVKLLDRCNNISGMAAGFSKEKMAEYIRETERLVYPLMQKAKSEYPMYSNQIFLIKYHMTSVIEAIKRLR